MAKNYVRVNLYWGGEVVYEDGSVRYNRRAEAVQRFPISLKYDRLQRVFRSKMAITDPNLSVVITGRYPTSITARGFPIYEETFISDDDSLSLFLRSPDIFSNHISIATLDMYATVERSTNIEAPTDDEFDIRDTTYLPAMNIGLQRGTLQQQSHNFGPNMQSCDIPGPSSAPDSSELGGGSIVRYRPTQVESFTER